MLTRRSNTRLLCVVVALVVLTAGCGMRGNTSVGLKRAALQLAFKDEEAAPAAVPPSQAVLALPAPAELLAPDADFTAFLEPPDRRTSPPTQPTSGQGPFAEPVAVAPRCPSAPPDAPTQDPPASANVLGAPKPGTYGVHSGGLVSVKGGSLPITFPYPATSSLTISDVQTVTNPSAQLPFKTALAAPTTTTFTQTRRITDTYLITDKFSYDEYALRLVERKISTSIGERVFRPSQPIKMWDFDIQGNEGWVEVGTDPNSFYSLMIEGHVTGRERVDVCGKVYDTWRITSRETFVNLRTGETSGTVPNHIGSENNPDDPNVYNVATQLGSMVLRFRGHFTEVFRISGSPVTVEWDFVSTLDSVTPTTP